MADIVFVAILIAFFALCVGFVRVRERIIGPDELVTETDGDSTTSLVEEVAGVSYDNAVGLVLSVLVIAYLVYALVFPEKL